jgi:hypothetical protein
VVKKLNAALANFYADYRIIYKREEEFSRRIQDIYLSRSTYGAPFLDQILDELWDILAIFFLESIKDTPRIHEVDVRLIQQIIETGDPLNAPYLFEVAGWQFCEMFHRDVYLYLIYNQFNFFDRRREDEHYARARQYNPTITEVW